MPYLLPKQLISCGVFLSWALLISCHEQEDFFSNAPSTYTAPYGTVEVVWLGNFRLFTRDGELKSKTVVNEAMRYDTSFHFQLKRYLRYNRPFDSIVFIDRSNADLHQGYSNRKYFVRSDFGQLYLTGKDTIRRSSYGEVLARTLPYHLGEVKPEVFSESLSSSTGGNFFFTYTSRDRLVLHRSGNQLSVPVIIYSRHVWNRFVIGPGFTGGHILNNLQSDFFRHLPEGDTVAITQYEIKLEKSATK
jgi:hypothetical protein